MDATAGDENWDVVLSLSPNSEVIACLPYVIKKKYGISIVGQPAFTHKLGPWIRLTDQPELDRRKNERKLINELYEKLPKANFYIQNWDYRYRDWLPLFWRGYDQITKYSYVIKSKTVDEAWNRIAKNIRGDIKKAKKIVSIKSDCSFENFFNLIESTFERQGLSNPFNFSAMKKLLDEALKRGCGKIYVAVDDKGRLHSGIFVIWDSSSTYYLFSGSDPLLRNSGSNSLCLWGAIEESINSGRDFDFEGSMVKGIENYFSGFGGHLTEYFGLYNASNILLKILINIIR